MTAATGPTLGQNRGFKPPPFLLVALIRVCMNRPIPPAIAATLLFVAGLAVAVGLTAGFVPSDGTADVSPALDTTGEGTGALSSPGSGAADGEPPYLAPPPETVTREEYVRPGIDLSAAAASDSQRLRGEHSAKTFEAQFAAVEDTEEFVESFVANLSARAEALDGQHAGLVADYRDGEISTRSLLRGLVRLGAAVTEQQRLADRVEITVEATEDVTLSRAVQEQSAALKDEIPALESPVVDRLVDGGFGSGAAVYAQAGAEGFVLAAPTETEIQRQATLRGQRDRNGTNQFIEEAGEDENPFSLAAERARTLYGEDIGLFPPPFGATTVYGIQGTITGGDFRAYLDGATENIFHESQTVAVDEVPVTTTRNHRLGTLELVVNATVPTGPMQVSVTDAGEPVEGATVQVANQTAGTTDANGQRWMVQPLGGAEVAVTVENLTVDVTLP